MKKARWYLLATVLTCMLVMGCSSDKPPEDQIKSFIEKAESAVEEKRIRDLREMIADGYNDKDGRSKKELINYIVYQTLRQKSIHLFTKVNTIEISTPASASVSLFAALTGRPVDSLSILPEIQVDLYKFQLLLGKKNNSWQLLSAQWSPAAVDEIFAD